MSLRSSQSTRPSVALTLPATVVTHGGAILRPHEDIWEWTDGPHSVRLDFRWYDRGFEDFVPSLKLSLLPFLKGHSCSHVSNLQSAFRHFVKLTGTRPDGDVTAQHLSNYAARLGEREVGRVGTLNVLLQKWVALSLPGVLPECATYLEERRKPGNRKGDAVRTRNPVEGPFSEDEYTALYSAVNAAYGSGVLPLWTLLLTRLMLACGGRISQYASLKICDFQHGGHVLKLPQAKKGEVNARSSFLSFDISPQTGRLVAEYLDGLRADGLDENGPFFPERLVMAQGPARVRRANTDVFFGHCLSKTLGDRFRLLMTDIAPPTARLDYSPMPLTPKRFRYTFGTRMAEEGCSEIVIANRMGHADQQQVHVYVSASPKIVENIDKAMGAMLAPLARAFKGRLVEDEAHTTHKGAPGSRIIDFRASSKPLGGCADKATGCAFNKPVACYSCVRFEPWLDAPHEKVLIRLETERDKWSGDERMAAVNDEPIRAVQEVIAMCAEVWRRRANQGEEDGQ